LDESSRENAERITLCVNTYDELLEALESVRMHKCMFDDDKSFDEACDKVSKAIKKAKGE